MSGWETKKILKLEKGARNVGITQEFKHGKRVRS